MDKVEVKQVIRDASYFRHACKLFDEHKKISNEDIDFILDTGRLSPSSFGMQGWKILLVTDIELRKKIKPVAWNQAQIDTCSHLLIFLTRTRDLLPGSRWVRTRFMDRGLPEERLEGYIKRYADYHEARKDDIYGELSGEIKLSYIYEWAARQTYIAMGNIMTASAMLGIDSCPIEGFEKPDLEKVLGIDTSIENVTAMVALGYRVNPAPDKHRLPLEEIVTRI